MTLLPLYLLQMLYNELISSKLYSINKYLLSIYSVSKLSVQFSCSVCPTLCDPMNRSTPGLPVHHYVPEFTQSHVHRVSDAIQPAISSSVVPFSSCPPSLPASESFPISQLFAWGGQNIGVSALASFLPKNTQGLISFRMNLLDLLAVQGTLKSLLQHCSSKASIL